MPIDRNEFLNNLHERSHTLIIEIGVLELRDNSCDDEYPLKIVIGKGNTLTCIATFALNDDGSGYHLEYVEDRPLGVNPDHFWELARYGYALLNAGYPSLWSNNE